MSNKRQKRKKQITDSRSTNKSPAVSFLLSDSETSSLCVPGYTPLDQNPEIVSACRVIADQISSMTIYLMANREKGDERIINELSRKVDITPNDWMTRKTFVDAVVMNLLLYGRGNSVVRVHTRKGFLRDLEPVDPARVSFIPNAKGWGYSVLIDGIPHDPNTNLLHFVHNPDPHQPWRGRGLTVALQSVADNLKQASTTEKGFLSSKWKPSIVVKVDALTDEFSSPAGRQKLLDDYMSTTNIGEPWIIPAEQFSIEQIRPLSLSDLALSDMVQLDKRTVAAIIGVPPFVLGIGEYNANAWNGFINNTVRPIIRSLEQELTRKLLISPNMYWRFNIASLYSYDLRTTAEVYGELKNIGVVTGNEVRDKIGMEPVDGLDELSILENYIPVSKIGDQKKLEG